MILNSKRLLMIADMVPECECMADIGTDHALLPIYLLNKGICKRAIASDVRVGPVKSAKKNISKYDLNDKIDVRTGSGLETIDNNECEVIVLAGMGGHLITELIESSLEKVRNASCIILQPNTEDFIVRKYLSENNFDIFDENAIKDGNHIYLAIACKYKQGYNDCMTPLEIRTGKILYNKKTQGANDYYNKMREKAVKIIQSLSVMNELNEEDTNKLKEHMNIVRWIDENVESK